MHSKPVEINLGILEAFGEKLFALDFHVMIYIVKCDYDHVDKGRQRLFDPKIRKRFTSEKGPVGLVLDLLHPNDSQNSHD